MKGLMLRYYRRVIQGLRMTSYSPALRDRDCLRNRTTEGEKQMCLFWVKRDGERRTTPFNGGWEVVRDPVLPLRVNKSHVRGLVSVERSFPKSDVQPLTLSLGGRVSKVISERYIPVCYPKGLMKSVYLFSPGTTTYSPQWQSWVCTVGTGFPYDNG